MSQMRTKWTKREVVELVLAGRKQSRRVGLMFEPDEDRLERIGFSPDDIARIIACADDIEATIEAKLASIDR